MEENNSSTSAAGVNPAKLFVGNLSWSVGDEDLKELFGQYGEIVEAKVITERFNPSRSKGIAFVEFTDAEAAQRAIEALNEAEFFERRMIVNVAQPKRENGDRRSFGGSNRNFGSNNNRRGGFSRDNNRGGDRRRSY